jgi:hypothetical protein
VSDRRGSGSFGIGDEDEHHALAGSHCRDPRRPLRIPGWAPSPCRLPGRYEVRASLRRVFTAATATRTTQAHTLPSARAVNVCGARCARGGRDPGIWASTHSGSGVLMSLRKAKQVHVHVHMCMSCACVRGRVPGLGGIPDSISVHLWARGGRGGGVCTRASPLHASHQRVVSITISRYSKRRDLRE